MEKKKILSGIQPSGKLHIGNYLGALSNFVKLQNSNEYDCFFTIVDYHSISQDYEPREKPEQTLDLVANFLATGIDPKKSTVFIQSHVSEHTELAWIFNCITPVSELERMTQYKDKAQKQTKNINMGLLDYPVLQAADILLYKPVAVPIGADQKQHLELTNVIARKFNNRFGKTFEEIKPLWTNFPKIMDLKNPGKKMSKSSPEGCVFLDDEPKDILRKLKYAVAASDSRKNSPGEENLMRLLSYFGSEQENKHFKEEQASKKLKYSELKDALAKNIASYFAIFKQTKKEFLKDSEKLKQILSEGAKKAKTIANQTLLEVKEKIGVI